ncbi:FtsX-like permease family protein [Candidatus Omnitrophota bacterium]
MSRYELWITLRYLTARRKESFISIISLISILGVAVGVMALIIVIAVMTGFDNDLRAKILGTNSHILVEGTYEASEYPALKQKLEAIDQVKAVAGHVNGHVFLRYEEKIIGLALRGINPQEEIKVTELEKYLTQGTTEVKNNEVIIGKELADSFWLGINDSLSVYSAEKESLVKLKVAGIFNSGMYDYDMNLIFTNIATAQEIFQMPGEISGMSVSLKNVYKAAEVKKEILKRLDYAFSVRTWMEINRNFFAALRLEKITMFIILTLIVLVAAFNIVSTLIVIVTQKVKDIGILKSMGATRRSIRKIFTFQGLLIGCTGTALGLVLGVGLSLLLKKYQFITLPQDIYYIRYLPVDLQWPDIATIAGAAILISFLATLYPASKAARLDPVEALRYE